MKKIDIKQIYTKKEEFSEKEITVGGWIKSVRDLKTFAFMDLNDGTSFKGVQVVINNNIENYEEVAKLNTGSSVLVCGTLFLTPENKQPFELQAKSVQIISKTDETYPLQKKGSSLEFLRENAYLRPRANLFNAVFRVRSVAAIAIHKYDGGPVFFRQKRCTRNGRVFEILKFRSMIVDAEKDGKARLATENDDRITPVGHFIRKTRIDELPQFFNILKGDMSFVGPRPERPEIVAEYEKEFPEFDLRMKVKAGLTGYAQVYGKYNTTAYDKLKLDLIYVQKYSLLMDLRLIFMTVKVIFMKESTEGLDDGERIAK